MEVLMDKNTEHSPPRYAEIFERLSTQEGEGLSRLGYKQEFHRNRSMVTLLFRVLSIAAIPYGEGGPLMTAIYDGGPLSIFFGWIVVCILDESIALSLAELAIAISHVGRTLSLDL
ncbi:hypothetical protein EYZ11_002296 [Aspergillus tanneri]|nr:hypothetical protein EYZ11_002296 [Aspergillus tanneri]